MSKYAFSSSANEDISGFSALPIHQSVVISFSPRRARERWINAVCRWKEPVKVQFT